jgi:hypothetical protein
VSPDPVAWLVIEEGWEVIGPGGKVIGTVADVFGDENADIFDGLLVANGLTRGRRYVPAEHITGIYEGRIEVNLDEDALELLEAIAPGSVKPLVR